MKKSMNEMKVKEAYKAIQSEIEERAGWLLSLEGGEDENMIVKSEVRGQLVGLCIARDWITGFFPSLEEEAEAEAERRREKK